MSVGFPESQHPKIIVCLAAAVCEDPPEVSNAEITGLQREPYTYKSVIRYSCRAGTLVGEREIWCTKHGTWSAPAPECKGHILTEQIVVFIVFMNNH